MGDGMVCACMLGRWFMPAIGCRKPAFDKQILGLQQLCWVAAVLYTAGVIPIPAFDKQILGLQQLCWVAAVLQHAGVSPIPAFDKQI